MAASLHMVKVNKNLITYADRILLPTPPYRYSGAPYHPRIDHVRYIDPHTRHTHLIKRVTRRVKVHVLWQDFRYTSEKILIWVSFGDVVWLTKVSWYGYHKTNSHSLLVSTPSSDLWENTNPTFCLHKFWSAEWRAIVAQELFKLTPLWSAENGTQDRSFGTS